MESENKFWSSFIIKFMKKRVYGKKLSRGRGSRKALFRSLIRALVASGSIKTTKAKAKAVQSDIDRVVNMAKDGSVQKRRMMFAALGNDKQTTNKLIKIVADKLPDSKSGYTRIIPLPQRRGDMAEMARLEWVVVVKEKQKKSADKKEESKDKGVADKLKSVAKRGKKRSKKKDTKKKPAKNKKKKTKKTSKNASSKKKKEDKKAKKK